MKRRATARDVAELAGVSRTTVSFVLNQVPGVRISRRTHRRVLQAARELNYHPNASAQRLVTGKTRIIAYVERQDPERAFADAFLPQVLRGVHDAASRSDFEVLFAPVPIEAGSERCLRLLRAGHVDGLILSGPRSDDAPLLESIGAEAALVLQGSWPEAEVASVDVDNFRAARQATSYLLELGHSRVGMIVHADLAYTAARARYDGFHAALADRGLADQGQYCQVADFTPASGERAMRALLEGRHLPTAVFVSSDTVALGAMHAARQRGLRIPKDLAIVGFDDIPMAVFANPPLTTVRLPAYQIGRAAAELLMSSLTEDGLERRKVVLDTELIIRQSCGAGGEHASEDGQRTAKRL